MSKSNWNDYLLTAAVSGCSNSLQEALENGADIHCKDVQDNTALMLAAKNGHIDIVDILLEQGSSIDADNIEGKNAVLLAAQAGHSDCLEKIINAMMQQNDVEFQSSQHH